MEREIYKIIKKETLEEVLESLYSCMNLTVQLLDENGVVLLAYGQMNSYCAHFQKFLRPGETCAAFHQKAASYSLRVGEAYTFTCHSDLNHIVFPIVYEGKLLGSVLIGPFLMELPDMDMLVAVANRYHLNMQDALTLYDQMDSVKVMDPKTIHQFNKLMYHLFSGIAGKNEDHMRKFRGKSEQQSRISDAIQNYKSEEIMKTVHYPFEKEQLLIRKVRAGNVKEAKDILNDLLGYVLFTSGYSLIGAKTRSMELCTILARTVIEQGADEAVIMGKSSEFLLKLEDMHDIEALCYHLQELTEDFISDIFPEENKADKDVIQNAIKYMDEHFREEITLQDVANHVFLNAAYFSSVFKQSTGFSFKEYLTNIRIEEAQQMLIKTNTSIIDIALACGFTNQSYFSKVFKAKTGFSPKVFRN